MRKTELATGYKEDVVYWVCIKRGIMNSLKFYLVLIHTALGSLMVVSLVGHGALLQRKESNEQIRTQTLQAG